MLKLCKKPLAVALLGILAIGFALPEEAEARRYRRVVRRAVVAPVVVAPVRRRAVYAAPVRVRAPFVGVGVGYGAVRVRAPGVGVFVGF